MKVEILRHPTDADWMRCKMLALGTEGKDAVTMPTEGWKLKILAARHSPIRTLPFTIKMEVPYWVSVHYVRHKIGVEHYVRSQRNDRQHDYDRNAARQDTPVTHVMDLNADALITIVQKRLCHKAALETREIARLIADEVLRTNPEFFDVLREPCLYNGYCHEMRPCGNGIAEVYR
jgi:hypothetical protein